MSRDGRWDAIVVGGGHNGLVCAAYLARGGLRTLLLERRETVGGALATSELVPGARLPTYAHTVGRLRGSIARELGLADEGMRLVQPAVRVTSVSPDGPAITLWGDARRTASELAAVSARDGAAWPAFDARVRSLAGVMSRLMALTPPDPATGPGRDDLVPGLRLGLHVRGLPREHARALLRVLPQPVADLLEDHFQTDAVRALLATRGLRFSSLAPRSAGSAAWLLTDAAGNGGGAAGETVYARGGPGALAAAVAGAARRAGAQIRTGAEVVAVRSRESRAVGVALDSGAELDAPIVASGLDPVRTLLRLVDPEDLGPTLGWEVGNLRLRGTTAKVNLALAALPAFRGLAGEDAQLRLRGRVVVAPGMAALDAALDPAKYGRTTERPWLEATIPSLADPLLVDGAAASGVRHVMSVLVHAVPHDPGDGDGDAQRTAVEAGTLRVLEEVSPGFERLVVARQVLLPADLEAELGMTGGHPLHGEPGLDQWFAWRPLLGYARYRMPLAGLYLCGSGAHPGGGVTGMPGRNAAREILADHRRGAVRS
jgi:phytoene dehydrogenase-like protein